MPPTHRRTFRLAVMALVAVLGVLAVLWLSLPTGHASLVGNWIVHYTDIDVEIILDGGGNGTMEPASLNVPMQWWIEGDRLYFEMLEPQLADRLLTVLRRISGEQRDICGGWRVLEIRPDVVLLQGEDGADFHMTRKPSQTVNAD